MNEIIEKIIKIVKNASKIMLDNHIMVKQKGSYANLVTNHDVEIQEFLCNEFLKIIPGCGFICEENDFISNMNKEYVFVIDPIDGTSNYAHGIKESAISIALLKNSKPLYGVVYNPFHDEMFYATSGGGAYCNGNEIHVSNRIFEDSLFCTAMSLYKKEYAKICSDIIYDTYMKCSDVRRFGSCALELCYLAIGRCDLYFELRVFPWDYAAAYLILKEAGGVLKGFNGEELDFTKVTPLIGANNIANYNKLQKIVSKYLKIIPYEVKL